MNIPVIVVDLGSSSILNGTKYFVDTKSLLMSFGIIGAIFVCFGILGLFLMSLWTNKVDSSKWDFIILAIFLICIIVGIVLLMIMLTFYLAIK